MTKYRALFDEEQTTSANDVWSSLVDPGSLCGRSAQETQDPLSNRACGFPAHGFPMVLLSEHACRPSRTETGPRERHLAWLVPAVVLRQPATHRRCDGDASAPLGS